MIPFRVKNSCTSGRTVQKAAGLDELRPLFSGIILFWLLAISLPCPLRADTLRHNEKDIVYTGYVTSRISEGRNQVVTVENGVLELNLAEYTVEWNEQGRNRFISVLPVTDAIELEIETAAFEKALLEEADKGPLYILIEVDSPADGWILPSVVCRDFGTENLQNRRFCQGRPIRRRVFGGGGGFAGVRPNLYGS
jgi:hypothetical protein